MLFASIPNFTDFYSEDVNEGVECIRLLNEIIVDFDQILDDEKFRAIEKIKTIGSTYMAASGINPLEAERDELAHLCDLVDFAIEMKNKLDDINVHSFNTFQLRIGNIHFRHSLQDCIWCKQLGSRENLDFSSKCNRNHVMINTLNLFLLLSLQYPFAYERLHNVGMGLL